MPLISIIAYVGAKYISAKWLSGFARIFGYFVVFLLSVIGGGITVAFLYSISLEDVGIDYNAKNELPKVLAQGFWWAFIGLLYGIYKGKKARNSEHS